MPGPVSDSYRGPPEHGPYVPSWCYANGKPPMCSCGHHHGYHNDAGACLRVAQCKCPGYDGLDPDVAAQNGNEGRK